MLYPCSIGLCYCHSVPYLGFECDSRVGTFRLLPDKKRKFVALLEAVLSSTQVSLTDLQRLSGKCTSMSLAVPGARLYTNEINMAISRASRSSRPVPLTKALREEVQHWLFIKSWSGFLPWRSEIHHQFLLYSDASSFAWGSVLEPAGIPLVASDYWPEEILSSDIAVKEALVLSNALKSFMASIMNSRVDVYVDNSALLHAWNRQSAKSHGLSEALKSISQAAWDCNCVLRLFHVPSALNLADKPSRALTLADSRLSRESWELVQDAFGGYVGHSVDLMALPSNAVCDRMGNSLPFFSPWPTPGCKGVNVFAQLTGRQPLALFSNPYVFPPICLIPNVLWLLRSARLVFTLVVPDVQPRRFWWPLLPHDSHSGLCLGRRGDIGIIQPPSKSGYNRSWPLPWDLWAFRIEL